MDHGFVAEAVIKCTILNVIRKRKMKFNSLLHDNKKWTDLLLLSVAIIPFNFLLSYPRVPKVFVILLMCAATSYALRKILKTASNLKWITLVFSMSIVAIFISMILLTLTQFTSLSSMHNWLEVGICTMCFETATMLINRLRS